MKRVSGKHLARLLVKRGWKLMWITGSHHCYKHPDYPNLVTLPIHAKRTLKIAIQLKAMKAAGIAKDEL